MGMDSVNRYLKQQNDIWNIGIIIPQIFLKVNEKVLDRYTGILV